MRILIINARFARYGILGTMCIIIIVLIALHYFKIHGNRRATLSVTERMGSLNVSEVVKPGEITILSEPHRRRGVNKRRLFALILVTSTPQAQQQREAVRRTWGKWAKEEHEQSQLKVYFTIGFNLSGNASCLPRKLLTEQNQHDDLVIDNFEEGYYRLAGKMLRMLKWYNHSFSSDAEQQLLLPLFLIKTDHDVFLNLPKIVKTLKATPYYKKVVSLRREQFVEMTLDPTNPQTYYVGGHVFEKTKVISSPKSKWHLTLADRERLHWKRVVYPRYASGACYIISGNAVKPIYEASFNVTLFPFEDIYLTGFVAHETLNLSISSMEGMWVLSWKWNWTSLSTTMQAMHPVQSKVMFKICQKLEWCKKVRPSLGAGIWG